MKTKKTNNFFTIMTQLHSIYKVIDAINNVIRTYYLPSMESDMTAARGSQISITSKVLGLAEQIRTDAEDASSVQPAVITDGNEFMPAFYADNVDVQIYHRVTALNAVRQSAQGWGERFISRYQVRLVCAGNSLIVDKYELELRLRQAIQQQQKALEGFTKSVALSDTDFSTARVIQTELNNTQVPVRGDLFAFAIIYYVDFLDPTC